ncbi:telethonin-like [Terrapene carolina triunguis]|uniref:telethonin-like n=1 Tax=Terrapene triunguis TaxID=2587831 RepID=UPI000E77D58E|nr:telethonin-like [Terrapene carolina triunguis]
MAAMWLSTPLELKTLASLPVLYPWATAAVGTQHPGVMTPGRRGCSLREVDDRRKETYWQQQETRFVVQRSPWLIMQLGRLGEPLARYHLPYQRALPLPLFMLADLSAKAERGATPPQLRHMMDFETALAGGSPPNGQCWDKKAVAEITKELPPVIQPSRPDFGKGDFPRSLSQEAQRG